MEPDEKSLAVNLVGTLTRITGNRTFLVEDMFVIERKLPFQKHFSKFHVHLPHFKNGMRSSAKHKKRNSIAIRIAPRTEKVVFQKDSFVPKPITTIP